MRGTPDRSCATKLDDLPCRFHDLERAPKAKGMILLEHIIFRTHVIASPLHHGRIAQRLCGAKSSSRSD